jgi:hypothetical protein
MKKKRLGFYSIEEAEAYFWKNIALGKDDYDRLDRWIETVDICANCGGDGYTTRNAGMYNETTEKCSCKIREDGDFTGSINDYR